MLGRNQGDLRGDTHEDKKGYLDLIIKKDGFYKAGELHSWDYVDYKSIAVGFSPAAILINEGKDVEMVSKPFYSKANLGVLNPQTAFIILKGGESVQMVVDGRSTSSRGMTAYEIREFVRKKFPNADILAIGDGGGSTEMVIDGETVNKPSDGHSRLMLNGIAFIKHQPPTINKEKGATDMFIQRLSETGMKGNPFYYNQNENPYADKNTGLPNCTCYAMGRSSEIAGKTVRWELLDPKRLGLGHGMYPDAQLWYSRAHWAKGSTPKLGAILVWGGGKWGHVAIVEEILPDGGLIISQSNYQREIFQVMTIEKPIVGRETRGIGLKFLGYIYNPYVVDGRDTKNPRIDQVEVLATQLKVRDEKNAWHEGRYALRGLYDVLGKRKSTINGTAYDMVKLANNIWIAVNDKAGWTKTYLLTQSEPPKVEEKPKEEPKQENKPQNSTPQAESGKNDALSHETKQALESLKNAFVKEVEKEYSLKLQEKDKEIKELKEENEKLLDFKKKIKELLV